MAFFVVGGAAAVTVAVYIVSVIVAGVLFCRMVFWVHLESICGWSVSQSVDHAVPWKQVLLETPGSRVGSPFHLCLWKEDGVIPNRIVEVLCMLTGLMQFDVLLLP